MWQSISSRQGPRTLTEQSAKYAMPTLDQYQAPRTSITFDDSCSDEGDYQAFKFKPGMPSHESRKPEQSGIFREEQKDTEYKSADLDLKDDQEPATTSSLPSSHENLGRPIEIDRVCSPVPSPSDLTLDHCTLSTHAETPPRTVDIEHTDSPTTFTHVGGPQVQPPITLTETRSAPEPFSFLNTKSPTSNPGQVPTTTCRPMSTVNDPCVSAIALISNFASAVSFRRSSLQSSNPDFTSQDHSSAYANFVNAVTETKPWTFLIRSAGRPGFYLADMMGDSGPELVHSGEAYCLEEIAKTIKTSSAYTAGTYSESSLRDAIIKNFVALWRELVETCLLAICGMTQSRIHNLLASYFGNHKGLPAELRKVTDEKITSCLRVTRKRLQSYLRMEELGITLNEEYLFWYKGKVKTLYESSAKVAFREFGETRLLQAMARNFEEYEYTLDFMAEVRAYFQVAYKRFIDQVSLIIENDFIRKLHSELEAALIAALKPGSDNFRQVCEEWIREDVESPGLH